MHDRATSYLKTLAGFLDEVQVTGPDKKDLGLNRGVGQAVDMITVVGKTGGRIMIIGNGGSAAIASHMQNDLTCSAGIRSLAFNEIPTLTALSNDHGYAAVFERQVRQWAEKGDLLVAISSSGASANILAAAAEARAVGCAVVTMTGFSPDNPLRQAGDLNFYVPAETYGFVETAHSVLAHLLTDFALDSVNSVTVNGGGEKPAK